MDSELVRRLSELDRELRELLRLAPRGEATTLNMAIELAVETTDLALQIERGLPDMLRSRCDELLVTFLREQLRAREFTVNGRSSAVSMLINATRRMRALDSAALLDRQVCLELCDSYGFRRATVTRVDSDGVTLTTTHGTDVAAVLVTQLSQCIPEQRCISEVLPLGTDAARIPGAPHFSELLGSTNYVVAPVVVGAMVTGLLHASREAEVGVDQSDVTAVDSLAWAYSAVRQRVVSAHRLRQQDTAITRAAMRLVEASKRIVRTPIGLDTEVGTGAAPRSITADSPLSLTLSRRECEVFDLMLAGASNAQISDQLVITVATVKTHVRNILRKVGAINRSEVISLYLDTRPAPSTASLAAKPTR